MVKSIGKIVIAIVKNCIVIEPFLYLLLIIGKVNTFFMSHDLYHLSHVFFVCVGLIEVITCFYLKLTLLYIGITVFFSR